MLHNNTASTHRKKSEPKQTGTEHSDALSEYIFGKVPPQALELERAVLGALMIDREAISIIVDVLRPESFYTEAHQEIYAVIIFLYETSLPIDLLTVTEELRKRNKLNLVGGPYYLIEISNMVASSANIEYHSRIIAQKFIQRSLINLSHGVIKKAYSAMDVFDLVDETEQELFSVVSGTMSNSVKPSASVVSSFLKELEINCQKAEENAGITGVPSAITSINKITSGWQKSDFIVVAARPGMGKTAFVLGEAMHAAKCGHPVAIFNLEMSDNSLMSREFVLETEIPADKFKKGRISDEEWQRIGEAAERIGAMPIFIDDTPGLSVLELRAKCRRLQKREGIELVIVDYLQLMKNESKAGNREQEIASIARALKLLAKELRIPVIGLSQLSRAVETRGGSKRPQLSDLRESGALEQDADVVAFIYRPEYYGIKETESGESLEGIAEFIFAKHRNGALDTAKMSFKDICAKFGNIEEEVYTPKKIITNPATAGGDVSFPVGLPPSATKRHNDEDIPF